MIFSWGGAGSECDGSGFFDKVWGLRRIQGDFEGGQAGFDTNFDQWFDLVKVGAP
jgi:hypothetical protein